MKRSFLSVFLVLLAVCCATLFSHCGDRGGSGPTVPLNYTGGTLGLPSVSGKGAPPDSDVTLRVVSDSIAFVDTTLDTLRLAQLANRNWDQILDTLIDSTGPALDTLVRVWIFRETFLVDTTVTLNPSLHQFVISGLPAGTYTLTPRIEGELKNFYTSQDSAVTVVGTLYYSPSFALKLFGSITATVKSLSDSSLLFNTVQVTLTPKTLEGVNKVNTDSLGHFSFFYVEVDTVKINLAPKDSLGALYNSLDTVLVVSAQINGSYVVYLTHK